MMNILSEKQFPSGTLGTSIPCALSASQVTGNMSALRTRLGPCRGRLSSHQHGPLQPRLSPPAGEAVLLGSAPRLEAAPLAGPGHSCWESVDVLPGKRRCAARIWSNMGQGMLPPPWREGGTVLMASAGKAQAESSPLSTVTPTIPVNPLLNLSPWILQLFSHPAHFH